MNSRIFVQANNVHSGGGRSLLVALLKNFFVNHDGFVALDKRFKADGIQLVNDRVKWVQPSFIARFMCEIWLAISVRRKDYLFCFGNLPPIFNSRGRVVLFLQNRYLIEKPSLDEHSIKTKFRIYLERFWLKCFARNVDLFVVQTQTMKYLLPSSIGLGKPIAVLPFVGNCAGYNRATQIRDSLNFKYDFIYVSSGEPHKNHRNLVEAWCLLAREGTFPSLCLTVDEVAFPVLCKWMRKQISDFGLKVNNVGVISPSHVRHLYADSNALIFTSAFESLGLPLIEARQAGLAVLAPELDYVRDVLDPDQVFDPNSPKSIARAVKRFMGSDEPPLPLLDAESFLAQILRQVK